MLNWKTRITVEPTAEPVTVEEAKRNADIDDLYFNDDVLRWITRARKQVEHDARISLMTQTIEQTVDQFPCNGIIELLAPPMVSVTSVTYVDTAGDTQTLATSVYDVDAIRTPGNVRLKYDQSWPNTQGGYDEVVITYVAGYASASVVPEAAKDAIFLLIRSYFDVDLDREMPGFDRAYNCLIKQLCEGSYP